jgi:formate-dependent nitrite reductase membrane component NrfD
MNDYRDLPLLKKPVWTWEVPLYFFVGGTAGAAAVIGVAADLSGAPRSLVRDARRVAAGGAILSGPLLVADLGRPERFLNMLRVFKPQSPMSVGAWTLAVFGGAATGAVIGGPLKRMASLVSAATGLVMATYTGVLIGATAIPEWKKHASILPVHFGASALASAASLLELLGHDEKALTELAGVAAAIETAIGAKIEAQGGTDLTTRAGGMFSGPLPLILRLIGTRNARQAAAASALLGSLITRVAWIEAGKKSAERSRGTGC